MIKALRGMSDIIDEKARLYKKIVAVCEEVARNFGYEYIENPKLEETSLFKRSVGESSDIVGKEMYQFSDKSGNDICLRPEGTAGVVRCYIEHKFDKTNAAKRYFYHGSMFRYERPQKGRLREFHQFGIECFGEKSVYEDASVIMILSKILNRLGIKTTLKINSLGDKESMNNYKNLLVNFLNSHKGELCEDCLRRINTNPIRVLDCKVDSCQNILKTAPLITENLGDEAKADFDKLQEILRENGQEFVVDPKLVRGLDYYCKSAFEFISDEIGSQSAVGGGGRYDMLVEYLGGKPTCGVGFAIGIERLMEILSNKDENLAREGVYICALDEKYIDKIYKIALNLRKNRKIYVNYEAKNLTKHLKNADNNGALEFLCIGEDEAINDEIWYKNLENKTEKRVKILKIEEELA